MVLNICNFIQRTEQVPVELDISAIEEYNYIIIIIKGHILDLVITREHSNLLKRPPVVFISGVRDVKSSSCSDILLCCVI